MIYIYSNLDFLIVDILVASRVYFQPLKFYLVNCLNKGFLFNQIIKYSKGAGVQELKNFGMY